MGIESVTKLVAVLDQCRLLEPPQLDEVVKRLQTRFGDPRELARELLQRGWITPYHINQLFQGRAQDLVLGAYVLLERIGEGGMGQVFKARHTKLNRIVALKIVRKEWLTQPETVRRFQREIHAAAQLSHPNIVMAYDADQIGDTHFIAMEYVEGIDLGKLLKQSGAVPIPLACDYVRQAALGLQHAHEKGMVHRDIKPSNLLLTQGSGSRCGSDSGTQGRWGQVKILDMGLARIPKPAEDDKGGTLTQAGAVVGTPDYISPEQARDSRSVDIRADLYSLGCTLYHLLAGQAPFPGGTGMEKLFKHQLDEPQRVNEVQPQVPNALAKLVQKLMAKRPEDRYQTPAAAAQALESFTQGDTGPATPAPARKKRAGSGLKAPPSSTQAYNPAAVSAAQQTFRPTRATNDAVTPADSRSLPERVAPAPVSAPAKKRKKLRFWIAPLAALGLLLAALLLFAPRGDKTTDQAKDTGSMDTRPRPIVQVKTSPLDQLQRSQIPAAELSPELPAEVVAVLGESRMRHWGGVSAVAVSPDGRLIASAGSFDKTIRCWDAATGKTAKIIRVDGQPVYGMAFAPDGKSVIGLSHGQALRTWDVASGNLTSTPAPVVPGMAFLSLAPNGQTAVMHTKEGPKLWDVAKNQERHALPGGPGATLSFALDGQALLILSRSPKPEQSVAIVWDVATGREKHRLPLPADMPLVAAAIAPDGETVALASTKSLQVWNAAKEQKIFAQERADGAAFMAFAQGGKALVVSGRDHLQLLDAATGHERARLPKEFGYGFMLAMPSNGQFVALAGFTPRVAVWDLTTGHERFPAQGGHVGTVTSLALSKDGRTLASAGGIFNNLEFRSWDLSKLGVSLPLSTGAGTWPIGTTPDNQWLLTRGLESVTAWDMTTGQKKAVAPIPKGQGGYAAVLSPNGKLIALCSREEAGVRLLDVPALQLQRSLPTTDVGSYNTLAFSPDGNVVAMGDAGGKVHLWDTETGKEKGAPFLAGASPIVSVAAGVDGKFGAVSTVDGQAKCWETSTGRACVSEDKGATRGEFWTFRFAADGNSAVAQTSSRLKLWRLPSFTEVPVKLGAERMLSATYSPDGKTLLVADAEGRLVFFDSASGREIRRIAMPGPAFVLAFAADNRHIATGNGNGTIFILRLAAPGPWASTAGHPPDQRPVLVPAGPELLPDRIKPAPEGKLVPILPPKLPPNLEKGKLEEFRKRLPADPAVRPAG